MNEKLAVAFNDIDFCLRARAKGYLVVYNPYVQFKHYESKTRGLEDSPEKIERFNKEINEFKRTWEDVLLDGDPYYNINLSLDDPNYNLKLQKIKYLY